MAALLGALCSLTIMRGSDLTRLMVTLGVALILLELANKFSEITGGADGRVWSWGLCSDVLSST